MICDYCKQEIPDGTTVYATADAFEGVLRSSTYPHITNIELSCAVTLGILPTELQTRVESGELR